MLKGHVWRDVLKGHVRRTCVEETCKEDMC